MKHWTTAQRSIAFLVTCGVVAELYLLYRDTFSWMQAAWTGYAPDRFGAVVPLLFIAMATARFRRLPIAGTHTSWPGMALIVSGLLLFFTGYLAEIHFVKACSLIVICYGIVVYYGGLSYGRLFFFPFAVLVLMIPSVSFLLESGLGILLRRTSLWIGYVVLHLMGDWEIQGTSLAARDMVLHAQYTRADFSAPLPLLILTAVAADMAAARNRYKVLLMALFGFLFVGAHSGFLLLAGGAHSLGLSGLAAVVVSWRSQVILGLFVLITTAVVAGGRAMGGKTPAKRKLRA